MGAWMVPTPRFDASGLGPAKFPTGRTFSSWRPEESSIPEATQNALMTVEWIHHHENLAISGASGTGKSHFVEALAQAAIEADLRVLGLPCSKRRLPNSDKHPIQRSAP